MDVHWVAPALSRHRSRVSELLACGARRGTGISRCARGHETTLEFPFFDLWLDLCETCHGLWLDGDEERFVQRAGATDTGLEPAPIDGAYRSRASGDRATCHQCERCVHPRRTYLSAEGPICDDCAEVGDMAQQLEDDRLANKVKRAPKRLLEMMGELLDRDGRRLRRGGFTNWNL